MKLFLVTFSYAPSDMQSGLFAHTDKKLLEDEIVERYSDWDEELEEWYTKYVPVDRRPRPQRELGYRTVEFRVEEKVVDKPGAIHLAYSCC